MANINYTETLGAMLFGEYGLNRRAEFEGRGMCHVKDSYINYEEFEFDMFKAIGENFTTLHNIGFVVPERTGNPIRNEIRKLEFDTELVNIAITHRNEFISSASGLIMAYSIMNSLELPLSKLNGQFIEDHMLRILNAVMHSNVTLDTDANIVMALAIANMN